MNCTICSKELFGLVCENKWCNEVHVECSKCGKVLNTSDAYEYRGVLACEPCFKEVSENRERERLEIIEEENHKTKFAKGLDFSDSVIGRANKEILKPNIEIARKESLRLKRYESADKLDQLNK